MSLTIAQTRTGNLPIGVRRGWSEWQKDLPGFLSWVQENRLGVVDLGSDVDAVLAAKKLGLRIGSVDLDWNGMISPEASVRTAAVDKNAAQVEALATICGPVNHFTVMIPTDPARPRSENFEYMVESYSRLAPILEKHQAKVVIEGWPGSGVLCCTPADCAEFFKRCPSSALGLNFDPSHLLRMGIDARRFLEEFVGRVFHVHGKDTELLAEGLYHYGNFQEPTFGKSRAFGAMHWRYVIPGRGGSDWSALFGILIRAGYEGAVSIELEDADFNGTMETERTGLLAARDFLETR